jgi:ABC-type branched-subunit amino acid transport system substrate-binding protein
MEHVISPLPACNGRRQTLVAAAALGLWPLAYAKKKPAAGAPLLIHHIGPLSGSGGGAEPSREFLSGAQLALWQVNEAGGVDGRPVELELLDDVQDARKTAQLFRQVADTGKMLALFMPRTSPSIRAAIAISQETGVPIVAPQTGGSFITDPPKRTVFAVRASYRGEITGAVQHFHTTGLRRFVMLNEEGPFGEDVKAGFEQIVGQLQLGKAAVHTIANTAVEVSPAVFAASVRDTPDVVFLCISADAAAHYIRNSRLQGKGARFVSLSNTSTAGYIKALGGDGRGVMVMQVVPPPHASKYAISKEFLSVAASGGNAVSHGALQGYISAKVLIAGLKRAAPAISAGSLVNALESLDRLDLGGYTVSFGPDKRAGSTFVNPTLISGDGKFLS